MATTGKKRIKKLIYGYLKQRGNKTKWSGIPFAIQIDEMIKLRGEALDKSLYISDLPEDRCADADREVQITQFSEGVTVITILPGDAKMGKKKKGC